MNNLIDNKRTFVIAEAGIGHFGSLNLAKNALNSNPKYVSQDYQIKQLWGKKLQKSAQLLFKIKEM